MSKLGDVGIGLGWEVSTLVDIGEVIRVIQVRAVIVQAMKMYLDMWTGKQS